MRDGLATIILGSIGAVLSFALCMYFASSGQHRIFADGAWVAPLALTAVFAGIALVLASLALRAYVRRVVYTIEKRSGSQIELAEKRLRPDLDRIASDRSRDKNAHFGQLESTIARLEQRLGVAYEDQMKANDQLLSRANAEGVLNKLVDMERRLVATFESATLTSAGEFHNIARENMEMLRDSFAELDREVSSVRKGIVDASDTSSKYITQISTGIEPLNEMMSKSLPILERQIRALDSKVENIDTQSKRSILDALASHQDILRNVNSSLNELRATAEDPTYVAALKDLESSAVSHTIALSEARDQLNVITNRMRRGEGSTSSDAISSQVSRLYSSIQSLDAFVQKNFSELGDSHLRAQNLVDSSRSEVKTLHKHLDKAGVETVRQVESLLQLFSRVDVSSRRLPQSGGFAMNPDSLLLLSDLIHRNRPKRILELGSGASTIWLAMFARGSDAKIVSVDHLEKYFSQTAQMLVDFELDSLVDLRLSPLADLEMNGSTHPWYDLGGFDDISGVEMLIIDGPPQSTGPEARFPAFPVLRDRLVPGALIVIDDVHRDQESRMVETWMADDSELRWTEWGVGRTGVLRYGGAE